MTPGISAHPAGRGAVIPNRANRFFRVALTVLLLIVLPLSESARANSQIKNGLPHSAGISSAEAFLGNRAFFISSEQDGRRGRAGSFCRAMPAPQEASPDFFFLLPDPSFYISSITSAQHVPDAIFAFLPSPRSPPSFL